MNTSNTPEQDAPIKRRRSTTVVHRQSGVRLVYVPLANRTDHAVCDAADYERLKAAGVTDLWNLNVGDGCRKYVRCKVHRNGETTMETVARLIMAAGPGTVVRYRNGRTFDLRRSNLYLKRNNTGRRDADPSLIQQKRKRATTTTINQATESINEGAVA